MAQNGTAVFTNLTFSTFGPAGKYVLRFFCDGVQSPPVRALVQSSVASLELITAPSSLMWHDELTDAVASVRKLPDDLRVDVQRSTAMLRVVDGLGAGLLGKSPTVQLIYTDDAGLGDVTVRNASMFNTEHVLLGEPVPASAAMCRINSHPRVAADVSSRANGVSVLHIEIRFVTNLSVVSRSAARTVYEHAGRPIGIRFTVDGVSTLLSRPNGLTFTRLVEPSLSDQRCVALASSTPPNNNGIPDFFSTPGSQPRMHRDDGMCVQDHHPA